MINSRDIIIKNLPYNDFCYLVVKYASVTKVDSKSKIPNIQVILRRVNIDTKEFISDQTDTIIYLPMNELDIVKIGSVWKKQQLIKRRWNNYNNLPYSENLTFCFDFHLQGSEIVRYDDTIDELGNSISNLYKIYIQNSEKKRLNFINKTKYTKLTDIENKTTLLVPCMELFISTYAPDHKTIRQRFLQYNLDTAIDEFIIREESYIKDNKYHIRVKKKMDDNNIKFLAYMLFNDVSRIRAKKLWMSLEKDEREYDSKFPVRYPEVFPFHPTILNIDVDGVWLNQNIFLVLRINNRSLPNDFEVIPIRKKINVEITEVDYKPYKIQEDEKNSKETNENAKNPDDSIGEENQTLNHLNSNDFDLNSNKTPHSRESTQRILTEVGVIGGSKSLKYINIEEKYNVDKPVFEDSLSDNELEVIESKYTKPIKEKLPSGENKNESNEKLSSAEDNSSDDSKGVKKLILETQKTSETTEEIFTSAIKALNILIKEEKITNFEFINKELNSQINFILTTFKDTMSAYKNEYTDIDFNDSWFELNEIRDGKKSFLGYREYLLIEINIDEKFYYLLEIGRTRTQGYSGLVFESENNFEFSSNDLILCLSKIILNKGNYLKKDDNGIFQSIDLGINYATYKHYFNKKTKQYSNLKNKIYNRINKLKS